MSGPFDHLQQAQNLPHVPPESPVEAGTLLPPAFQFSQQSLQNYIECARRFQLLYVEGRRWPAAESTPVEEREHYMEQGSRFHLLVQRYLNGIPAELLTPDDPLLARWWQNFLDYPVEDLPTERQRPEMALSVPVGAQRVLARFDLLALKPGERAVIVDWKTTRQRPSRALLASQMQTRVYPYVLVEAGQRMFGGPLAPEQVEMIYWFAEFPTRPEVFRYDAAQHEANRGFITGLVEEINTAFVDEAIWPLTDDTRLCKYCVYRSLCERGERAGSLDEADAEVIAPLLDAGEAVISFDLDDIDEIAF